MKVAEKVAIVTGGGNGIGGALAAKLAQQDARVVVADLDANAARAVADGINAERPGAAIAAGADVADTTQIQRLITLAESGFGPVDLYFANAGITGVVGLEATEKEWDRSIDVNLRAHIRAAQLLIPDWVERGEGYFISTASAAGLLTQLGSATYAVTKHAAVGFAEWLNITYGDQGVRVSCLCPMGVNTKLLYEGEQTGHPLGDLATRAVTTAGDVLGTGGRRRQRAGGDRRGTLPDPPAHRRVGHVPAKGHRLRPLVERHAPLPAQLAKGHAVTAQNTNAQNLNGRTAIVTGASRGIGLAIAQRLAADGANVVLTARKQESADAAAEQVGGSAIGVAAHAVDEDAAKRCVDLTLDRFGSIDILINNAGTNPAYGPLIEQDHARFAKTFEVNLWAPLLWTSLAVKAWMGEHGGVVINTASIGGMHSSPYMGMYNATKAALIHVTKQLALELSPRVRVNAICPGVVRTRLAEALWKDHEEDVSARTALGRVGEPPDVAAAVAFLVSDQASWITGDTMVIDGGQVLGDAGGFR